GDRRPERFSAPRLRLACPRICSVSDPVDVGSLRVPDSHRGATEALHRGGRPGQEVRPRPRRGGGATAGSLRRRGTRLADAPVRVAIWRPAGSGAAWTHRDGAALDARARGDGGGY